MLVHVSDVEEVGQYHVRKFRLSHDLYLLHVHFVAKKLSSLQLFQAIGLKEEVKLS